MVKVLDHGYIKFLRAFGDDEFISQTARTSTESTGDPDKDAKLVTRLVRDRHTSPIEFAGLFLEIKMPIFVARQWMRHRTGCLTGDTQLHFDLPGGLKRRGNQKYTLTLDEIYDRFQPTKGEQGSPFYKRDKVRGMQLRSCNEESGEIYHTNIADIWKTGKKEVFEISSNGKTIEASAEHKFFTDQGWLKVKDFEKNTELCLESIVAPNEVIQEVVIDSGEEKWVPLTGYESEYLLSSHGRLQRIKVGRGSQVSRIKTPTVAKNYLVASVSKGKVTKVIHLHREIFSHFVGDIPEGQVVRHLDGNSYNISLNNLAVGTHQDNSDDTKRYGGKPKLATSFFPIDSIISLGTKPTYDIEVTGPYHNFSANGFIVHNSFNEFSGRYSEFTDEFYVPAAERCQGQSTFNKQGSAETLEGDYPDMIRDLITMSSENAYKDYKGLLSTGLTRELARIVLPTNYYTKVRWKIDLHNLMHFMKLREDNHAQYEIQVYANAIHEIAREHFPVAMRAYEDHIENKIEISPTLASKLAHALSILEGELTSEDREFIRRNTSGN